MPEEYPKQESYHGRKLSSGIEVVFESCDESENEVTFEFGFKDAIELDELSDLYTPGSGNEVIFDKLVKKGWLLPDGSTFLHFRMNVAENKQAKKIKFRYYLTDNSKNPKVN